MSENARDTQFAGFAALELKEIDDAIGRITERFAEMEGEVDEKKLAKETAHELGTILARRAYDLVQHAVGHALEYLHECGHGLSGSMGTRIQPTIPDIHRWADYGIESDK